MEYTQVAFSKLKQAFTLAPLTMHLDINMEANTLSLLCGSRYIRLHRQDCPDGLVKQSGCCTCYSHMLTFLQNSTAIYGRRNYYPSSSRWSNGTIYSKSLAQVLPVIRTLNTCILQEALITGKSTGFSFILVLFHTCVLSGHKECQKCSLLQKRMA